MELLLWTCLVLGLLGSLSMALSGMHLEQGEAVGALDQFDSFELEALGDAAEPGTDMPVPRVTDLFDHGHVVRPPSAHPEQSTVAAATEGVRIGLFSSFTIFAYLAAFGGIGLGLRALQPTWESWLIGGVAGFMGFLLAAGFRAGLNAMLTAVESNSLTSTADFAGQIAEVTHAVAAGAHGELAFEVHGVRRTAPGKNITGTLLPQGTKVRLGPQQGAVYLIEPLSSSDVEYIAVLADLDRELQQDELSPLEEPPSSSLRH